MNTVLGWLGSHLARYLAREVHVHSASPVTRPDRLLATLRPGDVLLVEGHSRVSTAIKYLTQSTWSHAALYVGPFLANPEHCFVEADTVEGVRSAGIHAFKNLQSRICRPVGLTEEDRQSTFQWGLCKVSLRQTWSPGFSARCEACQPRKCTPSGRATAWDRPCRILRYLDLGLLCGAILGLMRLNFLSVHQLPLRRVHGATGQAAYRGAQDFGAALWAKIGVLRLLAYTLVALALATLAACGESPRPDLKRLYRLSSPDILAAPVILIPGAFGTRLRDRVSGEEAWPGPWWRILFSSYPDLALGIDPASLQPLPSQLESAGIADQALRRDFYGPILKTLEQFGGYARAQPGTPARQGERRFYVLSYDWRQDTLRGAVELHRLIEAVRRDYADPGLKVDIVAHSMGGLIARYYLRFGTRDVLDGEPHQVAMDGTSRVRKLILLGTPNLGSVSSLHAFISGEPVVVGRIAPHTLASFPSGYQLFPHPLNNWLLDQEGKPRHDELFDPQTWQRMGWSVFDPERAADPDIALRQRYFAVQLERARRMAWMLSAPEPESPIRYILFGGGCHLTPARLLVEAVNGRETVRLTPSEIAAPRAGLNYEELMAEPGDGRVTKPSLLARETLDPGVPQNEDSFLPVAYAFFLCEDHRFLTSNINFQDNLLNALLSASM